MIPAEVNLCNARVARFYPAQNDELMVERLDWLEECREAAIIQLAKYQQKLAQHYNRAVKTREFSAEESHEEYVRYKCQEVSPSLGRTVHSYCHRRRGSVLFGR